MPCRFCDAPGVTREDGWPKWVKRALPEPAKTAAHIARGETVTPREHLGPSFKFVVKCACRGCNGGWMARLEEESKPILLPLILGESGAILDEAEQRILARWGLKTAMVLEFSHPRGVATPASHRHDLRDDDLPDHAQIWIAQYDGRLNTFYYHDHHRVPHPEKTGETIAYAVTFGIGRVMFHIWVPLRADRQVEHVGRLSRVLQQIWPVQPSVTVSEPSVSDEDLAWIVASQRTPVDHTGRGA